MSQQPLALELLARQHDEIDVLLGELAAGEGDLERARRLLCQVVEQHMSIEEKVFYPALARAEALGSFVDRMHDQHRVIRETLAACMNSGIGSAGFEEAVRLLNEAVDLHVQDEEQRAFEYAIEHLGGELDAIAVELESQREAARGAFGVG